MEMKKLKTEQNKNARFEKKTVVFLTQNGRV